MVCFYWVEQVEKGKANKTDGKETIKKGNAIRIYHLVL